MTLEAHVKLKRGAFALDARFSTHGAGVTALFGPSGAGKSLLLAALAGLERVEVGRVTFGTRVLDDPATSLHVPTHERGIGLVFQDARLFPHLNVRENLSYAAKRAPQDARAISIADAAAFFDIAPLLERSVRNLSGGERSRVALARAILAAPDFLLLDEPFAALDGARRRTFLGVLRRMNQHFQLPMLVVTHQIDDVAALAHHVIAMQNGAVVASGAPSEVARGPLQTLLDARDTGAPVRIEAMAATGEAAWVRADHVLLANVPPVGLSARHVWPSRIVEIRREAESSLLVLLDSQVGALFARVTPGAASELGLSAGAQVWAIVKTHAL